MDQSPEPAANHDGARRGERRSDIDVRVRRAPKYGTFMAIGAVLGAIVMLVTGMLLPPGVNEAGEIVDTTPVIGLGVVTGFVVGAGLGGLLAVIIDRALAKRGATLVAELLDVSVSQESDGVAPVGEGATEASFESRARPAATSGPLAPEAAEPAAQEPEAPEPQDRDRPSEP